MHTLVLTVKGGLGSGSLGSVPGIEVLEVVEREWSESSAAKEEWFG
jgi:hypothetical protein